MAIAIIVGIIAGIIGFLPLFAFWRLSLKRPSVQPLQAGLYGLAGTAVSLVVVIIELLLCKVLAPDFVLYFGIAEIAALIVTTAVYVALKNGLFAKKNER